MNIKHPIRFSMLLGYIFLILVSVVCLFPFLIMVINATHSNADLITRIRFLPGLNIVNNYKKLTLLINPIKMTFNSLLISLPATLGIAYVCSLTAYTFSKFQFKGSKVLFWIVLSTMMIPPQMSLIGLFQLSKKIGILNTYIPLIFPALANASTVFFLKTTFDENLNISLLEAARMEGMGEFKIFNHIALPLCQVGIATISIFNFVNIWNNYLNPLTLLNQNKKYPLSIGIAILRRSDPTDLGAVYLGLLISVIPILVVYAFCSKFIIGGMLEGSVKG